jgi:hypothetical protein
VEYKNEQTNYKNFPQLDLNLPPSASGFTELLRNFPEYSGDFLYVKEIPPLNFLRRIP